MINGIIKAIRHFEQVRKDQAGSQSDVSPWLPVAQGGNAAVAPLGSPANSIPYNRDDKDCCCKSVCPDCIDYQMHLNQAI